METRARVSAGRSSLARASVPNEIPTVDNSTKKDSVDATPHTARPHDGVLAIQSGLHARTEAAVLHSAQRHPIRDSVEAGIFEFYVEEAGRWLDIVSPAGHMSKTVPKIAMNDILLYSACLAYASHVLYLLGRLDKHTEERYGNAALSLLILKLSEDPHTWFEGSVLSTTVLLRVSEQFSEVGDDQQYHLNGAFRVSASVGRSWSIDRLDLETTAFWTYLRMTVRQCFLCEQGTNCNMTLIRDHEFDEDIASEAGSTNRISHLLAKLCNACWAPAGELSKSELENIKAQIVLWRRALPASFDPWATFRRRDCPFTTVKYFSTWHVIAWQFYHAAEVLLAVHLAMFLPPTNILAQNQYLEREILIPTRKLCGATFSTNEIGVEINGAALVAWCGQFLLDKDERSSLNEMAEQDTL
ncbi:hypothetical protein LTR37_017131 [Vermiconidia calcicola]|uniref:Uncharacterized protein n=1 Tax=Vermiconidia calcicola TaxID=1690605 RepID=A0ACC3MMG6_9PEZI|nr:hypothetical protein LTR37_017131 [Vermiconidia calcicola]